MNIYLGVARATEAVAHWVTGFRCRRRGHDWLLGYSTVYVSGRPTSEFIPITDICLRCGELDVSLPWGECLGGQHPLAEHYNPDGTLREHPTCPVPS